MGHLVYVPPIPNPPHFHDYPEIENNLSDYPIGSIWQCDCGEQFVLTESDFYLNWAAYDPAQETEKFVNQWVLPPKEIKQIHVTKWNDPDWNSNEDDGQV